MDKQRAAAVYLGIVGGGALFWFVNNVSHDARAGYAADGFRGAVEQSTVTVTNFGLRLSVDLIDVCVGLAAVAAVALAVWVHRLTVGTERRGEEHGSARWGKSADIAGFMNRKEPARNLLLTKTERLNLDRPARPEFQRNHNVMCIGAAGVLHVLWTVTKNRFNRTCEVKSVLCPHLSTAKSSNSRSCWRLLRSPARSARWQSPTVWSRKPWETG